MKKLALSALVLLSATSFTYAETLHSLDKDKATKVLADQTITTASLITLDNKIVHNTATVYFSKDGKTTGHLADKSDNVPQNDEGVWSTKSSGIVCVNWQHWHQSCVYLYKLNNSVIFVNEKNNNLESLALTDEIKSGNQVQSS